MRDSINRRDFLKQTGTAGLGLSLASYLGSKTRAAEPEAGRKPGPNDTITVAVIGTNSRGMAHLGCLSRLPGVEIAYICDVDDRSIAKGMKRIVKRQ